MEIIKVLPEDLSNRFRSKQDLYRLQKFDHNNLVLISQYFINNFILIFQILTNMFIIYFLHTTIDHFTF